MTRRNKILLAVFILLLLIIIALMVFFYFNKSKNIVPEETTPETTVLTETQPAIDEPLFLDASNTQVLLSGNEQEEIIESTPEGTTIKAIAMSFTERFGSFSNQSDFENIEELHIFMTENMKNWADAYVKENRAKIAGQQEYYGISTKVVSTEIKSLIETEGVAELLVNTQRIEYKGAKRDSRIFFQSITLDMKKLDNVWYVDAAYWN